MSHNYSDIGPIKIDAHIITWCAHAVAITSDKQLSNNGFDGVQATSNEADGKCTSFVTSDFCQDKLSTIFTKIGVIDVVTP